MTNFVSLYQSLDQTNSTLDKIAALSSFFKEADPEESALAMNLILGNLKRKRLKTTEVTEAALTDAKIPRWLFEESYASVGDLAETIALLVGGSNTQKFSTNVFEWLKTNSKKNEEMLLALRESWKHYEPFSLMVLMKLITGGLRIGVARGIVIKALAATFSVAEPEVAHSLMGKSEIKADYFESLRLGQWKEKTEEANLLPYPFALASPIEGAIENLGNPSEWAIEWKWDGIRGQWIYRQGEIAVWSRGEELITDRFPEFQISPVSFESVVLDGEILAWQAGDEAPLAFQFLQTRIGRIKLTPQVLKNAPARFLAYDCLELNGEDLRARPLTERREILVKVVDSLRFGSQTFGLSTEVEIADWNSAKVLRETARERGVEGFILKRKSSPYFTGRRRGDWWKWKIDPMTLDAVLVYAQAGHGKRSNLFTDYTFALYDDEQNLVPVAKAYSGLDDDEIKELDKWVRAHTKERFGPVRSVDAAQVFELGFEGIAASGRHKSGIALRFPRILRWRQDKPLAEIDRLSDIRARYLSDPT